MPQGSLERFRSGCRCRHTDHTRTAGTAAPEHPSTCTVPFPWCGMAGRSLFGRMCPCGMVSSRIRLEICAKLFPEGGAGNVTAVLSFKCEALSYPGAWTAIRMAVPSPGTQATTIEGARSCDVAALSEQHSALRDRTRVLIGRARIVQTRPLLSLTPTDHSFTARRAVQGGSQS